VDKNVILQNHPEVFWTNKSWYHNLILIKLLGKCCLVCFTNLMKCK
jgi:hypothetical protein